MKNNRPSAPSSLRQQLDMLGAQFDPGTKEIDPLLVMTCLNNVSMEAAKSEQPIPDDVFAPGLNDQLMRCALSGLCLAVMQIMREKMNQEIRRRGVS